MQVVVGGCADRGCVVKSVRSINGLVPWFGGKRAMASVIVDQLLWRDGKPWKPGYFCEPFFGSGAVSFAMPKLNAHIVNDLHADLINLACVLASLRGGELIERCERTLTSEQVYKHAVKQLESLTKRCKPQTPGMGLLNESHMEWAWAFVVASWMGPNGQIGMVDAGVRFAKRYGPGGGDPATRMRSITASMPGLMERLRRFTIHNEDAIGLLEKINDTHRTAIYIDSPYLDETRTSGRYLHDFKDAGGETMFGEPDDHQRLADVLGRFEHARIVVSYEDHPRLDELYPGWNKMVLERHKNTGNTASANKSVREVLLVNGDVFKKDEEVV